MALEANTSSLKCYIGIPKRTSQILKGWFAESEKIHPSMNKLVILIKFLIYFSLSRSWQRIRDSELLAPLWQEGQRWGQARGHYVGGGGKQTIDDDIFSWLSVTTLNLFQVSILITSLTDIISFYTAVLAPYPYVKIFCLYTGTALAFNFIYQVNWSKFVILKTFANFILFSTGGKINFLLFPNVCIWFIISSIQKISAKHLFSF